MSDLLETDGYLDTPGPFTTWPASMLEDLYMILCRKRCSSYYLHLLIQPQLRRFKIQPGTVHYALGFLQDRCPKLQCLELTGSVDIIPEFFITVFRSFPYLVKINLHGNVIDERSFDTIGSTCHGLVVLNVGHSTITDCGLKFLSRSEQNTPRCQQLQNINLLNTRVSKAGVGSFLFYPPLLTDLVYEDTIGALAEMNSLGCAGLTEYRVKVLSCQEKRDINKEFLVAVEENPDYEGLEIVDCFLRSSNLYPVMNNHQLQYLQVGNSDSFFIDFEEGIAPILSSCGANLQKLVLDKFRYIDICLVGRMCPSLQNLSLSHVISWGQVMNICPGYFSHLEELQLSNQYGSHLFSNIIKQLLFFSSKLQYLQLQMVDCLDDILWFQIICQNSLTNLISLTLDQCHSISGDIIEDLVNRENNLQMLNVLSCRFISNKNKETTKKIIVKENFDLCFR